MLRPPQRWGALTQLRRVSLLECRTIAAVLSPPQRLIWTSMSAQALAQALMVIATVMLMRAPVMPSARRPVRAAPDRLPVRVFVLAPASVLATGLLSALATVPDCPVFRALPAGRLRAARPRRYSPDCPPKVANSWRSAGMVAVDDRQIEFADSAWPAHERSIECSHPAKSVAARA